MKQLTVTQRKFTVTLFALTVTFALLALGNFDPETKRSLISCVEWVVGLFMAGNGVEHVAKALPWQKPPSK